MSADKHLYDVHLTKLSELCHEEITSCLGCWVDVKQENVRKSNKRFAWKPQKALSARYVIYNKRIEQVFKKEESSAHIWVPLNISQADCESIFVPSQKIVACEFISKLRKRKRTLDKNEKILNKVIRKDFPHASSLQLRFPFDSLPLQVMTPINGYID